MFIVAPVILLKMLILACCVHTGLHCPHKCIWWLSGLTLCCQHMEASIGHRWRSPVDSLYKGTATHAFQVSLLLVWTKCQTNTELTSNSRRHDGHLTSLNDVCMHIIRLGSVLNSSLVSKELFYFHSFISPLSIFVIRFLFYCYCYGRKHWGLRTGYKH